MSTHDAPAPTRAEVYAISGRPVPKGIVTASAICAVVGTLVFMFGAFKGDDRAWQALHFNWLFLASISSAGVMFVAVQRIVTARWSRAVIRFMEGYVAFLPVALVLLVLLVTVGRDHVFNWARAVPPSPEKQRFLSPGFFTARVLLAFGVVAALQLYYVYTSVRLDVGLVAERGAGWARGLRARMRHGFGDERRELHSTHSRQGTLAVVMALVFGYGWSILAFDLSMSLDLYFQSTLYGWWFFMGGWLGALVAFALLTMWWERHLDAEGLITPGHFHDIGKLCFAFTAFWGYLTFGQYLVLWYANVGEETHWPGLRLREPWVHTSVTVIFLTFVVPFFGLLSKGAKVFRPTLALFAACSLLGLWLLRYIEVYPSLRPQATSLPLGAWEIAIGVGMLGLWGLCYSAFMNAFPQMRVVLMTSPYRDEVQVPVDPRTMEPLPAHE
ncbi:MAG: membrane protein [Gemmatimonadaceae bacterium]